MCFGEPRLVLIVDWVGTEDVRGFSMDGRGFEQRVAGEAAGTASVLTTNLETFFGLPSKFLERLVGESKTAGSTFSLSKDSSKGEVVWRRLDGEYLDCLPDEGNGNAEAEMAAEG